MRSHWQNLNEDRHGQIKGPGWRHGRAWLYITDKTQFRVEWKLPSKTFHFGLKVSTDEDLLRLAVCVPPVSLYLGLECWPLSKWLYKTAKARGWYGEFDWGEWSREISLRIFDTAIWWHLWRNPHGGKARDWRSRGWHPFGYPGSRVGKEETLEEREVEVSFPEKTYKAVAVRSRAVVRGNPWPFLRETSSRVELKFSPPFEPVPVPGKGENSWDCDEDAIYGSGGPHETILEAVGEFVADTLRTREHRGGRNWRPRVKAAAE